MLQSLLSFWRANESAKEFNENVAFLWRICFFLYALSQSGNRPKNIANPVDFLSSHRAFLDFTGKKCLLYSRKFGLTIIILVQEFKI